MQIKQIKTQTLIDSIHTFTSVMKNWLSQIVMMLESYNVQPASKQDFYLFSYLCSSIFLYALHHHHELQNEITFRGPEV